MIKLDPMATDQTRGPADLHGLPDDTLLDLYDDARAEEQHDRCDGISAELIWRGIEVTPCGWVPGEA